MSKELVISATPHETRVAVVEDGQLCEIYIEREKEFALVGSLYKGRVTRVLPGMQSAFVDIGLDSDAFLYVSDFLEHLEDYDHVAAPVENKFQKAPQPVGEVFAPSTTNAGIIHEPVVDAAPSVAPDADAGSTWSPQESRPGSTWSPQESRPGSTWSPQEPPLASPFAPNASTESWNAPETGASAPSAESSPSVVSNAGAPPTPPVQRPQRPFEQRPDRGGGGFNDRGGRGGRNRRWGRQGSGGRDRRPGRDLPPSKYASPKPFDSRPRESQPYEPPPADYQPIILPGESLAKYKDRIPAAPAPAAPPVEAATGTQAVPAEPGASTDFARDSVRDQSSLQPSSGLPDSLYASSSARESVMKKREEPVSTAPPPMEQFLGARPSTSPQQTTEPEIARHELEHEPEAESEMAETAEVAARNGATLSDDEVNALAEQLAEAKHEEAQAEGEDLPEAEETAAEPFVEAAELEELQDALHDDHVADAEEAEATADAMHDEALAAESGTERTEERTGESSTFTLQEQEQIETPDGRHDAAGAPPPSSETQPTSARISDQPRARFQRPMRRGGPQRGGRRGGRPNERRPSQPSRPSPRHEQHRRPLLISEMLKAGEEIIVQIAKEPLGKKARASRATLLCRAATWFTCPRWTTLACRAASVPRKTVPAYGGW